MTDPAPDRSSPTPPRAPRPAATPPWARWVVLAYLGVQVGLPLLQLAKPRPARFGWQMYSAVRPVDVFIVDASGARYAIAPHRLDVFRGDLDPLVAITPALCASPDVIRVVTVDQASGVERIRDCGRGDLP